MLFHLHRKKQGLMISRELSMPPLSNLNLSRNHTPVHGASASLYSQNQQYMPKDGMAPHQSPPAAAIQSWAAAGDNVQQPQPKQPPANPMGGIWSPGMDIKFGGGPSGGQQGDGQGQQKGVWKPGSGIKFG